MISKYHRRLNEEEIQRIQYLYLDREYSAQMVATDLRLSRDATYNWLRRLGIIRTYGEARKLALKHQRAIAPVFERRRGVNHPHWKGGFMQHYGRNGKFYLMKHIFPEDPYYCMAYKDGCCLEHRYVMAQHLGRPLTKQEVVHHINGLRADNRLVNLAITNRNNHSSKTFMKVMQKRIRDLEAQLAQQRLDI